MRAAEQEIFARITATMIISATAETGRIFASAQKQGIKVRTERRLYATDWASPDGNRHRQAVSRVSKAARLEPCKSWGVERRFVVGRSNVQLRSLSKNAQPAYEQRFTLRRRVAAGRRPKACHIGVRSQISDA